MSTDGDDWFLLNASPEIRQQIESFPPLHPRRPRHSPIQGIFLTNGDLDHCLGLLSLRESHPLVVYATEPVFRGFTEGNVLFRTLQRFPDQVTWRPLKAGREDEVLGAGGRPSGLLVEPVPVPGKPPIHLEGRQAPDPEDGIGLRLREARSGHVLAYFSGVAALTPAVRAALADARAVFFDGTFWSSDELITLGVGEKRAEQMAHLPGRRTGREPRRAARPPRDAPCLRPPEQHEPAPARGLGRARGGRRRRLGGRVGRHDAGAPVRARSATGEPGMSEARRRFPARSSSSGCAARARPATTTTTATTS